jgi:hypothetical protein
MPAAATMWLDDPAPDWSSGDPARLADVLEFAYPTADAARGIGLKVGLDWVGAPASVSVRETWIWALTQAAAAGRVLELAAVVLHDPASSTFHVPLTRLLGDRLGEVNGRIVSRYGLPPEPSPARAAVVKSIVEAETAPGPPGGELQAITSVRTGFEDPESRIQAVRDLMARTAMIEIAGQPAGTGFLVGERLVLTAAHVFDPRKSPPDRMPSAKAVFDYKDSGRAPAETGNPVKIAEYVTGSLPTAAEAGGTAAAAWDAPGDRLDFALLLLAEPVPEGLDAEPGTRGHYTLSEDEYDFSANARYMIIEHPLGAFVKLSEFYESPQVSPGRTRIRYGGNTLPGSSGSAVVDFRGRLVALHHYAYEAAKRNQGIPIDAIARTLLHGEYSGHFTNRGPVPASAMTVQVDPFATTAVLRRRPFLNRENLRDRLREMAKRSGTRTLSINGESGSGVSYSYQLASHVAEYSTLCPTLRREAPKGLHAVRIDLRAYVNVPVETIRGEIAVKLLMELGIIETRADPLAQEARGTVNLVDTLGPWLKRSQQQWWFFFDSIDNAVAVKQGEVDELIHALIVLADDEQVPLRIVLAGNKAEEFAAEHTPWAEREYTSGLTRGDAETWLRKRAEEESAALDEAELAAKLAELFPVPGPLPMPRVLGPELMRALAELLGP